MELLNDPAGLAEYWIPCCFFSSPEAAGRRFTHRPSCSAIWRLCSPGAAGRARARLRSRPRIAAIQLSDDTIFVQQEPSFALWGYPRPIHVFAADAPEGDRSHKAPFREDQESRSRFPNLR